MMKMGYRRLGAQLTYYLILSIFPYLILLLNVIRMTPLSDVNVLERLLSTLPVETQKILSNLIGEIISGSNYALLSIGALGGIWAASNGVMSLIKAVNRAYDLAESRPFWKLRGLAILFTLLLTMIMVISIGAIVFGEIAFKRIFTSYTWSSYIIWKILQVLITVLLISIILTILYKMAPSIKEGVHIKFVQVIPGGIFASVGLIISSTIFSFYVNNFGNYSKTYGSLGGIIVLLIWLYIISIIIVLGAEINAVLLSRKELKESEI